MRKLIRISAHHKHYLPLVLLFVCCSLRSPAQHVPVFKPLRYDEDYSGFRADTVTNWYHKTKFSPLSKDGATYISFGGDIRYQYFYFRNEDWGDAPKDRDGYVLSRYLIHADLHAGKYFRSFVQLQSSLANGKLTTASPVDENQLDLHQAFVELKMPVSSSQQIIARVGRQELSYGSQRLVGVREGPNNRQSFDAAKLIYLKKHFQLDGFFSHYVRSRRNIFDDGFDRGMKFWGGYAVLNDIPVLKNVDLYYLGLSRAQASFDEGMAKEVRHSFGARIWKRSGQWRYDFEGLYQSGTFGAKKIAAWTLSSNASYNFDLRGHNTEIGLKTELISGDRKYNDDKLNSFNPLYPRGAYFGLAALIGPSNLADIHPSVSYEMTKKAELSFDYDVFWRYSANDGIYAANTSIIYSGRGVSDKFIGQQYSTELAYTPNDFLYLRIELTWFQSGTYLKSVGAGKDILFAGFTTQIRF